MATTFQVKIEIVSEEAEKHELRGMHIINSPRRWLPEFSDVASGPLFIYTPVESGDLIDAATITKSGRDSEGYFAGAGPISKVGDPTRKAPKGTIKAFLKGFPKFKLKYYVSGFSSRMAWHYLSDEAKQTLDFYRAQGAYGGAQNPHGIVPAYWGSLVKNAVPGSRGNPFVADASKQFIEGNRETGYKYFGQW